MSDKVIPQNIFGDKTNVKPRCTQPPGGASSIVFGDNSEKSEGARGKNRQASDIFNLDSSKDMLKKSSNYPQDDTKNRLFGETNLKATRKENTGKSFNPITGGSNLEAAENEEKEKQDSADGSIPEVKASTASAAPTRRQPPGGMSTKLW